MSAAYLAADAAALGDRELPAPTMRQELLHSAQMIQGLEEVIESHLRCLEAAGARFNPSLTLRTSICLSQLAAAMRMEAMRSSAGRTVQ
ncbi:MAG: hypothetical protein ACJ8LG_21585 [Massilia sp.]